MQVRKIAGIAMSWAILAALSGWCVEVGVVSTPEVGEPGAFITPVFSLLNDSSQPDTYSLAVTSPMGWNILGIPASISLQSGQQATLFVTLAIPSSAQPGSYPVQLAATSQSAPDELASATIEVAIEPRNEIELSAPSGAAIAPGHAVTYSFVLANLGNVQDAFSITASSSLGLALEVSQAAVALAPQEELTFTVRLSAAAEMSPGRDVLTVSVASTLFDAVAAEALVVTSILPPGPDQVEGTVFEEMPSRIRWSLDQDVMTGLFDSQLTFSTSGQVLGGYFSSFFSLQDPFGPSQAQISSFSMLYRKTPSTFTIGNVSQQLTDLLRLSCTGGSLRIDEEYYDLALIGGGSGEETRFAGHLALGPQAAQVGFGYFGVRDPLSTEKSIWTANAYTEPLEGWDMTLEGGLGLDGPLTSRALFFNTTLDVPSFFFSGSVYSVGTFFPGQYADSAGIEVSQRLRLSALSLSASYVHKWNNVIRDPLQFTRIQDVLGFSLTATPLEDGPTMTSTLNFTWDRYADLSAKDNLNTLLSIDLTEAQGVFPYAVSARVFEQVDRVAGSHVRTTTYSEGVGLAADDLYFYVQLTQQQAVDALTDTELSSSSDVTVRFRPETSRHDASFTFVTSQDDFSVTSSLSIRMTDDLEVVFDGAISWDRHDADAIHFGWGISFDANLTLPLPFLATKGRLEGRAFLDRDGDGFYGINDHPLEGMVLAAGAVKVSTGADGYFRFPPFYPGPLSLVAAEVPPDVGELEPQSVTVISGETIWVELALRPVLGLAGGVFDDADRDGAWDTDEQGLEGIRVWVSGEGMEVRGESTDAAGAFTLPDLAPGSYSLSLDGESLPDRFVPTTPVTADVLVNETELQSVLFGGYILEPEPIVELSPPTAFFSYTPAEPTAGESVRFDASSSADSDGRVVAFAWDFDGDGQTDAAEPIATYTFAISGSATVSLTVTDNDGNSDTMTQVLTLAAAGPQSAAPAQSAGTPIVSFQVSPARPMAGALASLNGTLSIDLDGQIVSFAWDFDDDGVTDSQAPLAEHVFPAAGVYPVTLTVTDNEGRTAQATVSVEVAAPASVAAGGSPPIADFVYVPARPEPGARVTFNATLSSDPDGRIATYAWDFDGDEVTDSTSAIVDHTFPESGVYSVALTVTDAAGNRDTLVLPVRVVAAGANSATPLPTQVPPTAAFDYSPSNPVSGLPVVFNGTLSTDPDGRVVSFAWDFDSDGVVDSASAITEFSFQSVGRHTVSLRVTDNDTLTDTVTLSLEVSTPPPPAGPEESVPPQADFEYSPPAPQSGELVSFNGLLSSDADGDIASYAWDFDGDGVIDSTESFAQYSFPAPGTYSVSLTVLDQDGYSDIFIRAVLVSASPPPAPPASFQPPVADFTYMPVLPTAGELVLFDGTPSWDFDGHIVSYAWDFNGDGSSDANTPTAEHIFPAPGKVTVSLTVTDDSGASDTLSILFDVQ